MDSIVSFPRLLSMTSVQPLRLLDLHRSFVSQFVSTCPLMIELTYTVPLVALLATCKLVRKA